MLKLNKASGFYLVQLVGVLLLASYLVLFSKWQVQTNILSILPSAKNSANLAQAEQALFEPVKKSVTLAISGEQAIKAYHALELELKSLAFISPANHNQPTAEQITQFYLPYKDSLLSKSYQTSLQSEQGYLQFFTAQLTQMTNPFVSASLADASRLNLADYLNTELNQLVQFEQQQGIFTATIAQQQYYLMFLQLNQDAFAIKQSQHMAQQLILLSQQIAQQFDVEIAYSGMVFHTAASSIQAEQEISTFGVLSLIGIIALIIWAFYSITPLIIAISLIGLAIIYGIVGLLLFFDEIHLLSFVFAVSLIGIVIDYCFHALVHNRDEHKPLVVPLCLGFVTTALGYGILASSPLALLEQVAVFMIFGLLGALLAVLVLLPQISKVEKIKVSPRAVHSSEKITAFILLLAKYRFRLSTSLLFAFVVLVSLQPAYFNDDIRLLNSSPNQLLQHEKLIAQLSNQQQQQRIIIHASTFEALLVKQEAVMAELQSQQQTLKFTSIAGLLPSQQRQAEHYQALSAADQNKIFDLALNSFGLSDPIGRFTPLTYDEFIQGPLSNVAKMYMSSHQTGKALWLSTSERLNESNLAWLTTQNNVLLYDKANSVSKALTHYRNELIYLLCLAALVVAVVLFLRYPKQQAIYGILAVLLSGIGALILSQLVFAHLNIFNLLAVLLILALAIDYVIFYQEQGLNSATLLAISLSALSSILAFGMLAFSATPAVQSFGLTVMFGIIIIFFTAPLCINKPAMQGK